MNPCAVWRQPFGNRNLQQAAVAELLVEARLDRAFAEGIFSDQLGSRRLLQGTGQDFRGACAAFIHQHNDRIFFARTLGRADFRLLALFLHLHNGLARRYELFSHINHHRQYAARIVADINDEALHALLLQLA
ncbi:hypothetical protein D3C73_1055160 [compost metagenome]